MLIKRNELIIEKYKKGRWIIGKVPQIAMKISSKNDLHISRIKIYKNSTTMGYDIFDIN